VVRRQSAVRGVLGGVGEELADAGERFVLDGAEPGQQQLAGVVGVVHRRRRLYYEASIQLQNLTSGSSPDLPEGHLLTYVGHLLTYLWMDVDNFCG
jgi:hypothetical protein